MSYTFNDAITRKDKLVLSYNNLQSIISQNKSKLSLDTQTRIDKISNITLIIKNSVVNNLNQALLNTPFKLYAYVDYCDIYINIFNYLSTRIYDLGNLSQECKNLTDYKVSTTIENGVKKLVRISPTNSLCQFTILEDLGQKPTVVYDPETQKITTEIILKSLDVMSLGLPYSDEDKIIIKNFISGVAGLNTSIVSNIKMVDIKDNNNLVAQISYNTSFPNTIVSSYSLPSENNTFYPKVEITVKLTDANIILPSKFSGDFNNEYIQNINKNLFG